MSPTGFTPPTPTEQLIAVIEKLHAGQAVLYEAKITALEKLLTDRIQAKSETAEQWQKLNDKALELQAEENKRRLLDLNNERTQSRDERSTFMRQETFNVYLREQSIKRDDDAKWKSDVTAKLSDIQARAATWIIAVGIGSSALTVIVGIASIIIRAITGK